MENLKVVRSKKSLIVVTPSGKTYTSKACTDEMYNKVLTCKTEDEILALFSPKSAEKIIEVKEIKDFEEEVKKSKVLTLMHDSIYWLDVCELSMPKDLVKAILKAEAENNKELLQSYKNFWVLCSLNPDSRARHNLFWFLQKYQMVISKSGLFVAYRNVNIKNKLSKKEKIFVKKIVEVEEEVEVEVLETQETEEVFEVKQDNTLNAFISQEYARVRFKLKKSAKNFFVGELEVEGVKTFVCNKNEDKVGTVIGDLYTLYHNLSSVKVEDVVKEKIDKVAASTVMEKRMVKKEIEVEEEREIPDSVTIYTDNHTKTMNILIGQPVSVDRKDCNPNQNVTCTHGLHVASRKWLGSSTEFGKVPLMVLINPADVVAVPPLDSYGKMRVCSYFPVTVLTRDSEGFIQDLDLEDGFDDDFVKIITDGLVTNKDDSEKIYTLEIPEFSYEINKKTVLKNLDSLKSKLKNKVV